MPQPFEVFEYYIDKLSEILAEKSKASLKDINKKLHRHYFENYFDGIGARTIIVENDYETSEKGSVFWPQLAYVLNLT